MAAVPEGKGRKSAPGFPCTPADDPRLVLFPSLPLPPLPQ